jgi:rhamnogalacturonyl hydrolase YesR
MRKVDDYTISKAAKSTDRDWIRATLYSGIMEAYHATGDEVYLKQAETWAEKHQWQVGQEKQGLNRLFCCMTWMELYLNNPDPKKMAPTVAALKENAPYSPAGAKVWYGRMVYADSLYGTPTLAMLYQATKDRHYLEILNSAFWDVTGKIFDKEENLYYRDRTYIKKKSRYGEKVLWSRGNGWVFAALPRILKYLPKDDPSYERYVKLYRNMAEALASRQGEDGFWRSNLDDYWDYPMPESSGTGFFVAGFAWGIREGILDGKTYLPVVIRGWDALVSAVHDDGRLGWVQPVDARPDPSLPYTTQEYAVGGFLYAGGQVYLLAKKKMLTSKIVNASIYKQTQMLPPTALKKGPLTNRENLLSRQINAFLKNQSDHDFMPTHFTKKDYIDLIAGQVRVMHQYQNAEGRIIDPVENVEKYFSTPCYAHCVAVLIKAGYPIDKEIIEGGMKALDVALDDMLAKKRPTHTDFYTLPMVYAYELFEGTATPERRKKWKEQFQKITVGCYHYRGNPTTNPKELYKRYAAHRLYNWNIVNVGGEWNRVRDGLGNDLRYVDYCMTMQLPNFSPYGMFHEPGDPLPYDMFARYYLTGMLFRGYRSFLHETYRDILWRGAWTSLFMQSPAGDLPIGYRSSQHIWNEGEEAVVFEIYASAYAKAGKEKEARAFKRAAHLALLSVKHWTRPDGTGYVVKNRYPIEKRHGYESYSAHTCYNLLAMSMLAQAWQFADDSIKEAPAPADVGGFVIPNLDPFHKVFANVDGNYIEYDTSGDHKYNPTGLLRIHLKNGHYQLGPSGSCSTRYCVGPAWRTADGKWHKLAELRNVTPKVEILKESIAQVQLRISYKDCNETVTIDGNGVTIEDKITKQGVTAVRAYYPMLVFDGKDEAAIDMKDNSVKLTLAGKSARFTAIEPKGITLQREGSRQKSRNGMMEAAFAETAGNRIVYRISADKEKRMEED